MLERLGCWLSFAGVLFATLCLIAGTIYLLDRSPLLYFLLLIGLLSCTVAYNTYANVRLFRLVGTKGFGEFPIDEPQEYAGIYRPHWEVGHIAVPMAKRRFALFPRFECWCPRNAPPDYTDALPDGNGPFIIRFVGRVSERGSYGHMGSMDRKVIVERVIESKLLNDGG